MPTLSRTQRPLFGPLVTLGAYLTLTFAAPDPNPALYRLIRAEQGVIELGTAALFGVAAVLAFRLWRQSQGEVDRFCRAAYLLFAIAAAFVALEEINYGQHLIDWNTPGWFDDRSTKSETNLHNLYDNVPARRLNAVATFGFPIFGILLPLLVLARAPHAYRPGHWPHALLPRFELVVLVIIAQGLTWLDDIAAWCNFESAWVRATELKELYWGWAAVTYLQVIQRRLVHKPSPAGSSRAGCTSEPIPASGERH